MQTVALMSALQKSTSKKEVIDKLSATLILQGYLDQQQKL